MRIISNRREIRERLNHAFAAAVDAYDEANHRAIREARDWGSGFGTTHRRNGEVVTGGRRNIVDLENLDQSQKVQPIAPGRVQFSWDGLGETPAALVHEGYTKADGDRIPARRWTRISAIEGNIGEAFMSGF